LSTLSGNKYPGACQSEAARIVTGGTKLTSIQKLYEETGWEKLLERREKHKLTLLYKIVNNQAPGYLLPDRVDDVDST
jgi:hypothetical protein